MSGSLDRPDIIGSIRDLARRIGILERRITPTATRSVTPPNGDIIFSYAGTLAASTSPPIKIRNGGFLASIAVALGTDGSSSTTLLVEKNGSTIATVTIPSGASDHVVDIGERVEAEDRLALTISSAGAGATDMTAVARFT